MSIAVVTGAGTGIGRAVALKFVAEGWRVAVVGRRREALDETIELAGPAGDRRMAAFSCDVSSPDAVARWARPCSSVRRRRRPRELRRHQRAAAEPRGRCRSRTGTRSLATNLHGAYYCVRAFLPGMRARGTGTIVNINSDVGKMARDLAGAAYVSSKFGLSGPDAADQCRGTRQRHPRVFDLSARREYAAARQAAAAADRRGSRAHAPTRRPGRVRLAGRDASPARDRRGDLAVDPVTVNRSLRQRRNTPSRVSGTS